MGEAKLKKQRLGEWYGKPVGHGHPDYVPPPEPQRPVVRMRPRHGGMLAALLLAALPPTPAPRR